VSSPVSIALCHESENSSTPESGMNASPILVQRHGTRKATLRVEGLHRAIGYDSLMKRKLYYPKQNLTSVKTTEI
jgi:hypothetical protein